MNENNRGLEQMDSASQKSALFIGGETLMMRCAEVWIEKGHRIAAVISDDNKVVRWAGERAIPAYTRAQAYVSTAEPIITDYQFSVVNLRKTPSSVLAWAQTAAINFHDGPLPEYAGLNVTNWALLNGETSHGITWHEMTAEIDRGDILIASSFPISDNETAFTLNAKCFQAGIESFEQLVQGLLDESLPRRSQTEPIKHYCLAKHRPNGNGVLDFSQPASVLSRMVSALDFGGYRNPICLPKIGYHGQWYVVSGASVASVSGDHLKLFRTGAVLKVTPNALWIQAANESVLKLEQARTLSGEPVADLTSIFADGQTVEQPTQEMLVSLQQQAEAIAQWEPFWEQQFQSPTALALPFHRAMPDVSVTDKKYQTALFSVPANLSVEQVWPLLLYCFARLADQQGYLVPVTLSSAADGGDDALIASHFCAQLPLVLETQADDQPEGFIQRVNEQVARLRTAKSCFSRDLLLRVPSLAVLASNWLSGSHPLSVELVDKEGKELADYVESRSQWPAALTIVCGKQALYWCYDAAQFESEAVTRLQRLVHAFIEQFQLNQDALIQDQAQTQPQAQHQTGHLRLLADYSLVPAAEATLLSQWNDTQADYSRDTTLAVAFEQAVLAHPDRPALRFREQTLSFAELNAAVNRLARYLALRGIEPGDRMGVSLARSSNMVIAQLAAFKLGAAYIPLDPAYPQERIRYMISDSDPKLVVTDHRITGASVSVVNLSELDLSQHSSDNIGRSFTSESLAYLIYTSGSTGKPKGVMVSHRNVLNFFAAMDRHIDPADPGVWLAVTSISFDISVLELFWTLTRGYTVVLYRDPLSVRDSSLARAPGMTNSTLASTSIPDRSMAFGLFFWNHISEMNQHAVKYELLFKAAEYADQHGFESVWTPERHFGSFGGDYPNPSVTSAAIAARTEHIHIRAGSCVLPLHHPVRVAEEWSIVDNISKGRVGISFAAGWQPNDFVLMPDNHANAKQIMMDNIEVVQALWRGEAVSFDGPKGPVEVVSQPRPVQKNLPSWLTTAGNPETFRLAGERGLNLLTHLLGQSIDTVATNIKLYRDAWEAAGHAGRGQVTLMLHTLVGEPGVETEAEKARVRELARLPMKSYLKSAMFLVKDAAWHFPTFKSVSEETGASLDDLFNQMDDQTLDDLLEFAFLRYYEQSGLFGSFQQCLDRVDQLKQIDVDEIGCLIDYGLEDELVLAHLPNVAQLLQASNQSAQAEDATIAQLCEQHQVTHLQCTPSQAQMLVADETNHAALKQLKMLLIGGEAFPAALANELRSMMMARILNVYGPTETTIWSTASLLPSGNEPLSKVLLGKPLLNTTIDIVDSQGRPLPIGVAGELVIRGEGVVPGYYQRPGLTSERFVSNPTSGDRYYRTGDLARWLETGDLEYLGRLDFQVKLRGYRIELGEIENVIARQEGVRQVVVMVREDQPGNQQLCAYLVLNPALQSKSHQRFKSELVKVLKTELPEFMVPSQVLFLDQMPLTPNRKIDRRQLPSPHTLAEQSVQGATGSSTSGVAEKRAAEPIKISSELEQRIIDIWQAALGHEVTSIDDNFFDIGGHSLLAIKVLGDLRALTDKSLQITDIFRHTTIRALAGFLAEHSSDTGGGHLQQSETRATNRRAAMAKRRRRR